MDLVIAFFGLIVVFVVMCVVLANFHPGDGSDLLDYDPSKRMETRYAAEFEDMEHLMDAHNARRRAEGLPEQTEDEFAAEKRREERKW